MDVPCSPQTHTVPPSGNDGDGPHPFAALNEYHPFSQTEVALDVATCDCSCPSVCHVTFIPEETCCGLSFIEQLMMRPNSVHTLHCLQHQMEHPRPTPLLSHARRQMCRPGCDPGRRVLEAPARSSVPWQPPRHHPEPEGPQIPPRLLG